MNRHKTDKQRNENVNSALFTRISRNLHPGHGTNSVMICIHYFFRQIFEPAQNGNKCGRDRHRIGGALRCVFLLAEKKKVRNANDEGSSWKSAANKTHM
jgi:hypothetical protein